ncbi:hypothetical protein [Streptomyces sp. NPDC047028]|uniref:hypothetical protein n=1 Tax=Streptomyces sp. NPDC047028 TaxID=3155793 RepID=UPI0034072DAB
MTLVERLAQADDRALAASALACLDRCVPLLGGDDEALRPLWAALADSSDWSQHLDKACGALTAPGDPDDTGSAETEAATLARGMLDAAPADRTADALRAWADTCSVDALRVHRLLDPATEGTDGLEARGTGGTEGVSPLVAAELRRQIAVLDLLAEHGAAGLRGALEASVEGRRILRAVVSRRARGRG